MISRRSFTVGVSTLPFGYGGIVLADSSEPPLTTFDDLTYPSFNAIDPINQFGNSEPDEQQKQKARSAWTAAPKGPRPFDVANYFVSAFSAHDPDLISQWPDQAAWNPLIVEFFRSTSYRAQNDLVPWCAAFVNWCLKRGNRVSSGSAASQSFLDAKVFGFTDNPNVGDLAVFTCLNVATGKSTGLGHVAFVAEKPEQTYVTVLGGNQSMGGKSMICRRPYPIGPISATRTIDGHRVPVTFKLNTYVTIV